MPDNPLVWSIALVVLLLIVALLVRRTRRTRVSGGPGPVGPGPVGPAHPTSGMPLAPPPATPPPAAPPAPAAAGPFIGQVPFAPAPDLTASPDQHVGDEALGDSPVGEPQPPETLVEGPPVIESLIDQAAGQQAPAGPEPVRPELYSDEPVGDEPVVNEPVGDEPGGDEPVGDEPVGDEPVGEVPVVEEPVVQGDEEERSVLLEAAPESAGSDDPAETADERQVDEDASVVAPAPAPAPAPTPAPTPATEPEAEADPAPESTEADGDQSTETSALPEAAVTSAGFVVHEDRIAAWRARVAQAQQNAPQSPELPESATATARGDAPARTSATDEAARAALARIRQVAAMVRASAVGTEPAEVVAPVAPVPGADVSDGAVSDAAEVGGEPADEAPAGPIVPPETREMPVVVGVGPQTGSPAGADIRTGAAPFEPDDEPAPTGERGSQFTWDWGQAAAVARPAPPPTTAARPVVGADDISLDPSDVDEYVTPGVDPMDEALRQQTEPPPTPTSEPPRSEWTAPVIGGAKDTTSYAADAGIPADTAPSDDVAAPLDGPEPATLAEASAEPASATVVGAAVAAAAGGPLKGAPGADRATEVEPTAVEHDSDADQSTEAEQSTDAEQSMAKGVSPGTGDAVEVEELDEPVQRPDLDGAQSVPEESSVEAAFDEPAFEEPVVVESVLEQAMPEAVEVAQLGEVGSAGVVDGHDELSVPGMGDAVEVEELDERVQRPDLDGAQSVPEESSVEAAFDEPAFEEPVVVESDLEPAMPEAVEVAQRDVVGSAGVVDGHDELSVPGMGDAVEVEELDEPVEVSDFHATSTVPYPPAEIAALAPLAGSDAVDGHDELSVPGMGDAVEVEELDEPVQRPDLDDAHRALGARDEDPQAGAADEEASESEQPQPADVVQEASMAAAARELDEEPDEQPGEEPHAIDEPDLAAEPQHEGPPQVEVADGVMQAPQLLATPVLDDTEDLAMWSALVAQHRAEGTYTPVRDLPEPEPERDSESEPESEPEPDVEPAPTAAAPVRISEPREVMDGGYGWGSAAPIADGAMPVGHPVKANWHWMKFQAPGDPWYDRMSPDVWFVDAQTARDNGFSRD